MTSKRSALPGEKMLLGASLTWAAGFVDAVGYLVLAGIYAANMSGNTVGLGIRSAQEQWIDAVSRLLPIAAFLPEETSKEEAMARG